MHPGGIIVRFKDEPFDTHQTGSVLPRSRLAEHIEAAHMAADDAALAKLMGFTVHNLHVALWRRHEFAQQVNVALFFDEMLGDPSGVFVRLKHHGEDTSRGVDPQPSGWPF